MNIVQAEEMFVQKMKSRNWSQATIKNYTSQIRIFLAQFKDRDRARNITADEIEKYMLEKVNINTRKHCRCAINAFYKMCVNQPNKLRFIPYPKKERNLPKVINREFLVARIHEIQNLKHKAIIALAYSVGLRVSEVINLKIEDIDSTQMIIMIRQAKGKKDRLVPMSEFVLKTLREYYLDYKPKIYLFNGQFINQYSSKSCNEIVKKYLGSQYHFHLLRHSGLTAMMENGVDIRVIQGVAGHSSVKTTQIYTHLSTQLLNQVKTAI
jgi:site-specific recombinase XerD